MKGITKERMIEIIQVNFADGAVIMENSTTLAQMWEQLGDTYFIENNRWKLTRTFDGREIKDDDFL
jgi:hypothetical protein